MGLAAPLNDRVPTRPLGALSARQSSGDAAFGSLITLGPRKFKKKPVLVLDPDELAKAHRQFELDGAHIMGEGDTSTPAQLAEEFVPPPRPAITLGLVPIGSDATDLEKPELGEDEIDESDLPPLPDSFADTDDSLGLADTDAAKTALAPPAKKRVGIDMVALRLTTNLDELEEEEFALAEEAIAQSEAAPAQAEIAEQASPAPRAPRKSAIESASEGWDLPFSCPSLRTENTAKASERPALSHPPENVQAPIEFVDAPTPATPETVEEIPLDDLADSLKYWEAEAVIPPEPRAAIGVQADHSHIRAKLIHEEQDYEEDERAASFILTILSRFWRWLSSRF